MTRKFSSIGSLVNVEEGGEAEDILREGGEDQYVLKEGREDVEEGGGVLCVFMASYLVSLLDPQTIFA